MNSENKFLLGFFSILGVTIILIVFLTTSYWRDHNKKIVELIGSGVNPVAAMCALQDNYGQMPVCLVIATKTEFNRFTDED